MAELFESNFFFLLLRIAEIPYCSIENAHTRISIQTKQDHLYIIAIRMTLNTVQNNIHHRSAPQSIHCKYLQQSLQSM